MDKEQYQQYLKSDHWKKLRRRKRRKFKEPRCAICASTDQVDTHHLFYRNIHDVQLSDLRLLCRRCHDVTHQLMAEGELSKVKYKSHHSMFGATKEKVKRRLGLSGRNLFKEASDRKAAEDAKALSQPPPLPPSGLQALFGV